MKHSPRAAAPPPAPQPAVWSPSDVTLWINLVEGLGCRVQGIGFKAHKAVLPRMLNFGIRTSATARAMRGGRKYHQRLVSLPRCHPLRCHPSKSDVDVYMYIHIYIWTYIYTYVHVYIYATHTASLTIEEIRPDVEAFGTRRVTSGRFRMPRSFHGAGSVCAHCGELFCDTESTCALRRILSQYVHCGEY